MPRRVLESCGILWRKLLLLLGLGSCSWLHLATHWHGEFIAQWKPVSGAGLTRGEVINVAQKGQKQDRMRGKWEQQGQYKIGWQRDSRLQKVFSKYVMLWCMMGEEHEWVGFHTKPKRLWESEELDAIRGSVDAGKRVRQLDLEKVFFKPVKPRRLNFHPASPSWQMKTTTVHPNTNVHTGKLMFTAWDEPWMKSASSYRHLQKFWGASGDFWQTLWTKVHQAFEGHEAALFYLGKN